jgi:hypothetical protein
LVHGRQETNAALPASRAVCSMPAWLALSAHHATQWYQAVQYDAAQSLCTMMRCVDHSLLSVRAMPLLWATVGYHYEMAWYTSLLTTHGYTILPDCFLL